MRFHAPLSGGTFDLSDSLRVLALGFVLAVNIDDQPVRIRQQEGFVVRKIVDFEHDARAAGLKLRHADLLQEAVIHIEALAHQRRRQLGVAQIEEDAVGIVEMRCDPNLTSLSRSIATRV